jgi:putative redox protein
MADLMVTVKQVEDTPTLAGTARQHQVAIDRPKEKGGLDEGGDGRRAALAGARVCFMSNLIAAGKAPDIRIDDLSVDVHGTLAAAPPRFESIALEVRGRSADKATFDKLIQIAERGCIVHNTLAGGVRVEVTRM